MLQRLERRGCLGHREHPADYYPQLAGVGQPGKLGAAVVIGDIREELGQATVDAIKKAGGDAAFLPLDVTDDHSWERCI